MFNDCLSYNRDIFYSIKKKIYITFF